MALRIEDYGLIGDMHTAALVGSDASIDWLCLPRFDSDACFAALLGDEQQGHWRVAPDGSWVAAGRRYRGDSLVLETDLSCAEGSVRITDCMPVDSDRRQVVRLVTGLSGTVRMRSEVRIRFDYGRVSPWLRCQGQRTTAVAGPDNLLLDGDVVHEVENDHDELACATFTVEPGQTVALRMSYYRVGERPPPDEADLPRAVADTERWWQSWASTCNYDGPYREAVVRSLLTLKAMSYAPTGGIVAAVTTSLPEQLGGERNWDYRYCWIRDATFTLLGLLDAGYVDEARAWREWLLRALAGRPEQMQTVYAVDGSRRLDEHELDLPGYAHSRPVRIGNAAAGQFQLGVYGELMDTLYQARAQDLRQDDDVWRVETRLMNFLEGVWQNPDRGIWEVRGEPREFVHSKVLAWAAFDRAVKSVEEQQLPGPLDHWKQLREQIREEICEHGYDADRNTFTQYYGSKSLDAALLQLAPIGFLPAHDRRIKGTVQAIEKELLQDGFVQRYSTAAASKLDGMPPGEGAFLMCSFWLVDNYALAGRQEEAVALFEQMLGLRNDLGLLSEEYDVVERRQVGNLPQAFSHTTLVNTAYTLAGNSGVRQRSSSGQDTAGHDKSKNKNRNKNKS